MLRMNWNTVSSCGIITDNCTITRFFDNDWWLQRWFVCLCATTYTVVCEKFTTEMTAMKPTIPAIFWRPYARRAFIRTPRCWCYGTDGLNVDRWGQSTRRKARIFPGTSSAYFRTKCVPPTSPTANITSGFVDPLSFIRYTNVLFGSLPSITSISSAFIPKW